jgi:hypothetical protein
VPRAHVCVHESGVDFDLDAVPEADGYGVFVQAVVEALRLLQHA